MRLQGLVAGLLIVLAGCGRAPPSLSPPSLLSPPGPEERVVSAKPVQLLWALAGPPAAKPVRRITYLLPGALSTSAIFGPLRQPVSPDHLVMEYRFPGMQGQPLVPAMRIHQVAATIAAHAARYPDARIDMLAFSTGGAIALEAAGRLGPGRPARLVILSGATPFPGAYDSALRGSVTLLRAAISSGRTSMRAVWTEYYKTLLYGYGWRNNPEIRSKAEQRAEADRNHLTLPVRGRGRAQTRDLLGWRLSEAALASGADILFLHGGVDPVFPLARARRLADRLGAGLCLVPGGGHLLMTTHPGILRRAGDYLEGRWQAGECATGPLPGRAGAPGN